MRVCRPQIALVWVCLCAWLLTACGTKNNAMQLEGMQGTASWQVTLADPPTGMDEASISTGIAQAFARSSQLVAGWDKTSEISRFNAYQGTDWFPVSAELVKVVDTALRLGAESNGSYDITIRPLIELWGFGSAEDAKDAVPTQAAIDAVRARIGYQKLQIQQNPPALRKSQADLRVELASIADGFAADLAGQYLESLGCKNYMVEIAGEIRTRGVSPRGDAWRIAIEKPSDTERAVQQGIRLENAGLATSGDYRNYFTQNGKRYSHTFDPATGYPVTDHLASVSVYATEGLLADAYATLLMAMGEQKGRVFAEQHQLAAFFIWRTDKGFETYATPAFSKVLMD